MKSYNEFRELDKLGDLCLNLFNNNDIRYLILNKLDFIDKEPDVDIKKLVNQLSNIDKIELLNSINNTLSKSSEIEASVVTNISEKWGKNVLGTFFKALSALGTYDIKPGMETSEKEILKHSWKIGINKLDIVLSRFKSLSEFVGSGEVRTIWYSINIDNTFNYGIDEDIIGTFRLTNTSLNNLMDFNFKSTKWLNESIKELTKTEIKNFIKVKKTLLDFTEKFNNIYLDDRRVLVCKTNTLLNMSEFSNKIKEFLKKFKFSDKIRISTRRLHDGIELLVILK